MKKSFDFKPVRLATIDAEPVLGTRLGTGPRVLLLPSPLIRGRTYKNLAYELALSFEVATVDLPECGINFSAKKIWEFSDYVEWIEKLLIQLNWNSATIVTHSSSGAIGVLFAEKYPHRVDRLILTDSTGAQKHSAWRLVGGRLLDSLQEFKLNFIAGPHLFLNFVQHPKNFFRQLRLAIKGDVSQNLARVRTPVLIAWAKYDFTIPSKAIDIFRNGFQHGDIDLHPTASHDWLITHPRDYAKMVQKHLN